MGIFRRHSGQDRRLSEHSMQYVCPHGSKQGLTMLDRSLQQTAHDSFSIWVNIQTELTLADLSWLDGNVIDRTDLEFHYLEVKDYKLHLGQRKSR